MKILKTEVLVFPEIKAIHFQRFADERGYFTEVYRQSDFTKIIPQLQIKQVNVSASKKGVIRGLHFQWNPQMGKLVRVISGHIIDLFLDIRKGSPTFGKIGAYDMSSTEKGDSDQWIWIPIGFAHAVVCFEQSVIEYLCTGEYNSNCEAGISPLAPDIDWSVCDKDIRRKFEQLKKTGLTISEKDKQGLTLTQWKSDQRSDNFLYK